MRGSSETWAGVLTSFMRRGVSGGCALDGVARELLGLVLGVGLEVRDDDSRGLGERAGVDMVMLRVAKPAAPEAELL